MPEDKARLVKLMPDRALALFNGTDCNHDHIQALIGAAKEGYSTSLKELDHMFQAVQLTEPPSTPSSSATSPSSSTALLPSSPSSSCPSSPATSRFLPLHSDSNPSHLSVLDVCDHDIEVLQRTEGLLEALEQLQSGLVQ